MVQVCLPPTPLLGESHHHQFLMSPSGELMLIEMYKYL